MIAAAIILPQEINGAGGARNRAVERRSGKSGKPGVLLATNAERVCARDHAQKQKFISIFWQRAGSNSMELSLCRTSMRQACGRGMGYRAIGA